MNLPCVRFKVRRMMVLVAVVAVLLVLLPLIWRLVSFDWLDDAYALWGAGEMVVSYMKDHDDRWPRGWDDLKPYFDASQGRVGWSFETYQQHVAIQWDVNVAALERTAKSNPRPTFRVITAIAPLAGTFEGHEPNEILFHYLRQKSRVSAGSSLRPDAPRQVTPERRSPTELPGLGPNNEVSGSKRTKAKPHPLD